MGDRANVQMIDEFGGAPVYFYTHWAGSNLPYTVAHALKRGESRWDDGPYLARIIFNEMTFDRQLDTTGYGISTSMGDGEDRIITVDPNTQEVTDFYGKVFSFKAFITHYLSDKS